MFALRAQWLMAVLFVGGFLGAVLVWLRAIGWFSVPDLEPARFTHGHLVLTTLLVACSHIVPRLVPRRRIAPRLSLEFLANATYRSTAPNRMVVVNTSALREASNARRRVQLAWAIAFSLGIALIGFSAMRGTSHGLRYNPVEYWAYFAVSLVVLLSHCR